MQNTDDMTVPQSPPTPDLIISVKTRVNMRLDELIPAPNMAPTALHAAERHAVLSNGGRIRPLLAIFVEAGLNNVQLPVLLGKNTYPALDFGCAIELVHAASLILDDLPCMDDADLRRGQASAHKQFGESTAILTAVALLNRAYQIINTTEDLSAPVRVTLSQHMSEAVGSNGLIAGQLSDLDNLDPATTQSDIERINDQKTGALFTLAVLGGAIIGGATTPQIKSLSAFATDLGLAFQLLDDFKDVLMSHEASGKSANKDADKMTLIRKNDLDTAKAQLDTYMTRSKMALKAANLTTEPQIIAVLDALLHKVFR